MQNVRQAIRAIKNAPVVAAVAVLSLALGIGAATSIFSIIDALVLRELPVKNPKQLVLITDGRTIRGQMWNYAAWDEIRKRPELFERAAAWAITQFNLSSSGEARYVDGVVISGSFFETLGVPVAFGRALAESDDRRGGSDGPVVVLSYRFWQNEFQGRADVLGRAIVLNGGPFTVVGVAPRYFFGPEPGRRFDVVIPLSYDSIASGFRRLENRNVQWLTIIARLRPGQRIDAATAMLRGVHHQIREATVPSTAQSFRDQYMRDGFVLSAGAAGFTALRRRFEQPLL